MRFRPTSAGQAGCPPLYGDQFHQRDDRVYAGGSASRTYKYVYAGMPTETTFGIQTRYDAISLGLTDTVPAHVHCQYPQRQSRRR